MRTEENLNMRQFTLLIIIFAIGTSVLLTPSQAAANAKESGWLAVVFSFVIGTPILALYIWIGRLQPTLNLFQHNDQAFGRWFGKIVSFIVVLYSLIGASTVLWTIGNFILVQIMPETPMVYISTLFMVIIVYGAKLGIETVARTAEIFFPWIIILLILIFIFSIPNIEVKNLQPLWTQPLPKIVGASIYELSLSTIPLLLLFALYPSYVNEDSYGRRSIFYGYILAGFFIVSITITAISVLGVELTSRYTFPTYVMAQRIEFIAILERMEAVIAISWVLSIFFKLFIYFYAALIGISHIMGLRNYRPITVPMGVIVIALSLIVYPSSIYASEWNKNTWIPLSLTIGIVYPLVLLLVSKIKSMKNSGL